MIIVPQENELVYQKNNMEGLTWFESFYVRSAVNVGIIAGIIYTNRVATSIQLAYVLIYFYAIMVVVVSVC